MLKLLSGIRMRLHTRPLSTQLVINSSIKHVNTTAGMEGSVFKDIKESLWLLSPILLEAIMMFSRVNVAACLKAWKHIIMYCRGLAYPLIVDVC